MVLSIFPCMVFAFATWLSVFLVPFLSITDVGCETHVVRFDNRCGYGTPHLIKGNQILTSGPPYTSDGPLSSAIAYLQTGHCGFNGEGCLLIETTLGNSHCPGCGSSTDLSLIPPHAFNVPSAFSYYNGCDGAGASCTSTGCGTAFFNPNDNRVQVACETDNVNLLITFCHSKDKRSNSGPAPGLSS